MRLGSVMASVVSYIINFKTHKKMDKKSNRFFLIFYTGILENKSTITGCCDITTNGYYLNNKRIVELLKNKNKGVLSIVPTNIIELSESDFEEWSSDIFSTEP